MKDYEAKLRPPFKGVQTKRASSRACSDHVFGCRDFVVFPAVAIR
jgi:hypothetical protein